MIFIDNPGDVTAASVPGPKLSSLSVFNRTIWKKNNTGYRNLAVCVLLCRGGSRGRSTKLLEPPF